MDKKMDRQTDGKMDRRTDGWMNSRINKLRDGWKDG